jgi:D-lactate dehydrogenase
MGRLARDSLTPPDPALLRDLERALGAGALRARALDRLARSADASIYRLIPEVVVRPRQLDDVRALFEVARRHGRGLTFRAAGTSLSGQAVTRGILVEPTRSRPAACWTTVVGCGRSPGSRAGR